ncbi:type II toxin-antitoxin system VapC family toxin [Algoriphagus boritolerans]|uniref:Predicted nucleic acid-binding protein, contains PIN domain n=1 Tax=Algoriphagus boritolerans DSM 17298 = JCM 18970 TaxID=1120964 RepID=A0A1H5S3H3_9BACT|nr:PIN domain-containing protein [Algoriphagus boritolerans]SEF45020.1 Predicted nucleic acid-binding protein, contains PIN domain [Algoriphagus boritolerans DSM 17298 = JCM 18970]
MKIFFDVNVILDFFLERSPDQGRLNEFFLKLEERKIHGFISISVLQTCCYYLEFAKGLEVTKQIAGVIAKRFDFLESSKYEVLSAVESDFDDIEDAIHYFIAINSEMEGIVTNDLKFLKHSKPQLPILTPIQLLKKL